MAKRTVATSGAPPSSRQAATPSKKHAKKTVAKPAKPAKASIHASIPATSLSTADATAPAASQSTPAAANEPVASDAKRPSLSCAKPRRILQAESLPQAQRACSSARCPSTRPPMVSWRAGGGNGRGDTPVRGPLFESAGTVHASSQLCTVHFLRVSCTRSFFVRVSCTRSTS